MLMVCATMCLATMWGTKHKQRVPIAERLLV